MPRIRRKGGGTPSSSSPQKKVASNAMLPDLEALQTETRVTRTSARLAKEKSAKPSSEEEKSNVPDEESKKVLDSKSKTRVRATKLKMVKVKDSTVVKPPLQEANAWLPNQEVIEDTPPKATTQQVAAKQTKPSSSKQGTLAKESSIKPSSEKEKSIVPDEESVLDSNSNSNTRVRARKLEIVKVKDIIVKPPLQEVNAWLPNQEVIEDTPPKGRTQQVAAKQTKPSSSKPGTLYDFPARLHWKMAHLGMPSTSTPKVDTRSSAITKRDIDTAFGFDDTPTDMPANYSAFISPIQMPSETPSRNRLQPVWKVNPLTQRNVECETPQRTLKERVGDLQVKEKTKLELKTTEPVSTKQPTIDKTYVVSGTEKVKVDDVKAPEVVATNRVTRRTSVSSVDDKAKRNLKAPKVVAAKRKAKAREAVVSSEVMKALDLMAPDAHPKKRRTRAAKALVQSTEDKAEKKSRQPKAVSTKRKARERTPPVSSEDDRDDHNVNAPGPSTGAFTEFSQLLHRYKEDEDEEPELRVDPKKIVRTYPSRRAKRVKFSEDRESECEYDFIPSAATAFEPEPTKKRNLKSKKEARSTNKAKNQEREMDAEAERWLEEKNKEFEDVLKVPLVIETSMRKSE